MTNLHADEQRMLRRIEALTGADADAAQRIARAVTSVLIEQLAPQDCAWLTGVLPPGWVAPAPHAHGARVSDAALRDFEARVAAREGTAPGFAREHAQSYCRALAEALEPGSLQRLTSRLPHALAALFEPPDAGALAPAELHARGMRSARRTLSEGQPVSRHPLGAARPQTAQQDSVARSDNPHADTKLSSSPGTTQERERETLSRGRAKP